MSAQLLREARKEIPCGSMAEAMGALRSLSAWVPEGWELASSPSFAATPRVGSGTSPGTIDTSLTGPTNYTSIMTGGSSGTKINEIVAQGIATTSAGVCNLFLYDGSNWSLIDQVLVSAVTSSTTALAFRAFRQYGNLVLPSSSWTLRQSTTVGTSQLRVTAYGADL